MTWKPTTPSMEEQYTEAVLRTAAKYEMVYAERMSPAVWKEFYDQERRRIGASGLRKFIEQAPAVTIKRRMGLIFPHTRLSQSGHLIASVAKGIIHSARDTVLAIGVLHGIARDDPRPRGIHGAGAPNDAGIWKNEFSLDSFESLLSAAAEAAGVSAPKLVMRYPFLVGENPQSLPGIDELHRLIDDGAILVATADMVHHGAGYGTSTDQQLPRESDATLTIARQWIDEHLTYLTLRDYTGFLRHANQIKSDFRDAGPVVAELLPRDRQLRASVEDLVLVDYSDVLQAAEPTWVAAATARIF